MPLITDDFIVLLVMSYRSDLLSQSKPSDVYILPKKRWDKINASEYWKPNYGHSFLCTIQNRATRPRVPWSGNLSSMNPIKNMWELTNRAITKKVIENKHQFIEVLISEWHRNTELRKRNGTTCIESMPGSLEMLIVVNRGITKYWSFLQFCLYHFDSK